MGVWTPPPTPSPELMDSGEYGGVVLGVRGPAGGGVSPPTWWEAGSLSLTY